MRKYVDMCMYRYVLTWEAYMQIYFTYILNPQKSCCLQKAFNKEIINMQVKWNYKWFLLLFKIFLETHHI